MSVPTTEIPQARQDELRARVDASVWGQLSEATHDRVMRDMNSVSYARPFLDEYLGLFNPSLTGEASRFGSLTPDEQAGVLDVATLRPGQGDVNLLREVVDLMPGSPGDTARGAIVAYVAWPSRAPSGLPREARERLTQWRAAQHGMRLTALIEVLRHAVFSGTSDEVRRKIVTVMDRARPTASSHVRSLLDEATTRWAPGTVRSGTRPIFSESLRGGRTLLDALHTLATGALLDSVTGPTRDSDAFLASVPFGPEERRDASRRRALGALISEVARPDESFNQSNRDTCFATCLLHRLARVRPAEYVRLSADLLMTGRAQLQNGDAIAPPSDAFAFDGSSRSESERLTESALSDYWSAGPTGANPNRPHYHNTNPAPTRTPGNPSNVEVDRWDRPFVDSWDRVAPTAEALLGQRFRLEWETEIATLRAHFAAHPDVPIFSGLRWGEGPRRPHRPRDFFAHEIDIFAIDPLSAPHGRIHYWNPWGARHYDLDDAHPLRVESSAVEHYGEVIPRSNDGPARRTSDDMTATQSMSVQEFATFSIGILVPVH